MTAAELLLLVILQTATGKGDMAATSGPHHGSFVNDMLDSDDGEYGVTKGAADDGDYDITGDMATTSRPHHGSFVNDMLDSDDGEYGVTKGAADDGDFDITGDMATTSRPHHGSFVNDMLDSDDGEYGVTKGAADDGDFDITGYLGTTSVPHDDSDHDYDVGVTERDDVGNPGLHRLPTSEFDITDLTKPVECRRMSISVRDQFQVLKERRGLIARALHSRAAQNQTYVKTVRLPSDMIKKDLAGKMGIIAGWGRTHFQARCSQVLLYMPLVVDSNANCKAYFPNYNARTSFCAGGVYGGSICNGDNGSPFTFGTTTGYVVIGVASFVFSEHCLTDFPAGFTRVTNYLKWISKTSGIKVT
ncbi:uncharacterized protein LOC126203802 [Schistocerca nitens]|uniref:uncharacterized protein LOC126203802 n=1 Tax=Schistocerca nitens TaxID=7011 RepID=UPI002118CFE1|nr:uncharacterized protein LOC126203802 [Schistocerca nitens]